MKRALFVRVGEDVLEALRVLTKRYRARNPGQRWSTADVVRSLIFDAVREDKSRNDVPKMPPPKKARGRAKLIAEPSKTSPTESWDA